MIFNKVSVIGAGGWGTALAMMSNANGNDTTLWSHDINLIENIKRNRINEDFLNGVIIPESIKLTSNVADLENTDIFINAIPTQYIRNTITKFNIPISGKFLVNGSKGIENKSLKRISELFEEILDFDLENYAVITGPSHAEETAVNHPTTVVVASENMFLSKSVQNLFNSNTFRVYTANDVIGCEIGGSLKNIVAIAAGVIEGLGLGDNTKAALVTRGLAEITRLGVALGAKPYTFSGLSGLGDLYVTCSSKHSRNRLVGELIGKGKSLAQILSEMKMIAEGVHTTESAYNLSLLHKVDMPITEQMYNILFKNAKPIDAIQELMSRESKREIW